MCLFSKHTVTIKIIYVYIGIFLYVRVIAVFLSVICDKGFCGGLNENDPNRLIYLNVWFQVPRLFRKD